MFYWLFIVVCLVSTPAWATVYWVNKAGPGSTTTACTSIDSANTTTEPTLFRTSINSGIQCLGSGDTLVVKNGLYPEQVDLNNVPSGGGSFATATRLVAQNLLQPRLVPPGGNECCGFSGTTNRDAWIIIEGFDVGGGLSSYTADDTAGGVYLPGLPGTQRVRVLNNKFHHLYGNAVHDYAGHNEYIGNEITVVGTRCTGGPCGGGGSAGHPFYINGIGHLIERNYIHHCRDQDGGAVGWGCYAIHARFVETIPTSDWIVKNNRIEYTEEGILIIGSNMQVYNNVLKGIVNSAIWNHSWGGSVYYGNTIINNPGCAFYANSGAVGITATATNNIISGNGNNTLTGCLEAGSLTGTTNLFSDPGFVGAAFGNYHIASAFSPAVNAGTNLPAQFMVDAENILRPLNQVTIGAFQFVSSVPPSPNIIALYHADGNANDSGGHASGPFNGTLTNGALANGAPIVSGNSFVFDGVNDVVTVPGTSTLRPAAIGMAIWLNSTTHPAPGENCNVVAMGNAWAMGWFDSGQGFCWMNFGPTAYMATGTVLSGTPQMLACAYDPAASGAGVRLWQGNTPVAFTPTTVPLIYTGSENLTIGNNAAGTSPCAGRVDEVQIANFAWTQSDIDAFFGQVTPSSGISQTRSRYTVANAGEGNWIGPEDTTQAVVVTQPWGQRWALHNASGGAVTENFRPYCRINHSPGGWGAWTELTNSFGSFGLRYLTDTAVNVGDSTTPLLTLDGFVGVPGKVFADVVDLTSPYDAAQKIALATGQHAEQEIRLQAGSPVTAGDMVQCKPRHESGADLSGGYGTGDVNIRTLTMLAVIAPATVRLGGVQSGGTFQ